MEMTPVLEYARLALQTALQLAGPVLLAALAVGLLVGVAQTLTQLHEPTVALVPRLLAVLVAVLALLPWMAGRWVEFAGGLIQEIPRLVLTGG
jgi:flagellar biosynthesis protein FliQ